jgi:hypothetical protein
MINDLDFRSNKNIIRLRMLLLKQEIKCMDCFIPLLLDFEDETTPRWRGDGVL